MENNERFNEAKFALIKDLNKVKKYDLFVIGLYYGIIQMNSIWMNFSKKQEHELYTLVDKTFHSSNFTLLGKRKKDTELKEKQKITQ